MISQKFADDVPVNLAELAEAMRVSRFTVARWKKQGYRFEFGHQTTIGHCKAWRREQATAKALSQDQKKREEQEWLAAALARLR
jgi:hypothetical protein